MDISPFIRYNILNSPWKREKNMHYIIFDLEWNQCADEASLVRQPICLHGEIVELGAVKLNDRFEIIDEIRLLIRPHFYPKLHRQIAALTGISDKELQTQGIPFPEAYAQFAAWCGEDCVWMTWSTSDLPILLDNLMIHGLDDSDLPEYCDVQRIFSREIMRSDTQFSLDTALAILKEKGDTAHDALHDARNTARVCAHLELETYLGEYTGRIFALPPTGKCYESRRDILSDPDLSAFPCPWCGVAVKCEPWISFGHGASAAYGICPEEDEFLLQLHPACHHRDEYSAKRLVFELTDDLWDIYSDKKEAAQGITP